MQLHHRHDQGVIMQQAGLLGDFGSRLEKVRKDRQDVNSVAGTSRIAWRKRVSY
jgi:hypothetical protein